MKKNKNEKEIVTNKQVIITTEEKHARAL